MSVVVKVKNPSDRVFTYANKRFAVPKRYTYKRRDNALFISVSSLAYAIKLSDILHILSPKSKISILIYP